MKNENRDYYEPTECFAPKDSASYAAWLFSLPLALRKIVIEENDRKKKAKNDNQ
jgi:hypothetical protein